MRIHVTQNMSARQNQCNKNILNLGWIREEFGGDSVVIRGMFGGIRVFAGLGMLTFVMYVSEPLMCFLTLQGGAANRFLEFKKSGVANICVGALSIPVLWNFTSGSA